MTDRRLAIPKGRRCLRCAGATLVEIVVALAILGVAAAALIKGYVLTAHQVSSAGNAMTAQGIVLQRIEQTRAAKWDTQGVPEFDELQSSNFPPQVVELEVSGGPTVLATNFTLITRLSTAPPLKMIRVDCVWTDYRRKPFTNTLVTFRAPDQ